ncbi:MAG: ATP-binding cassette domain-containing protein [Alicyclobacillus sp.]|nr:ATP-binding cassette domain-containing protein [Alicyclobacillus sp.]
MPETGAGQPLLQVRQLSKHFRQPVAGGWWRRWRTVHAVTDVSFDLWPGEVLGLVGESGSGKSTLARLLVRALTPSSGELWLNGEEISRLQGRALARLRPLLQLVFQDPASSLNPKLRVGELVAEPLLVGRRWPRAQAWAQAANLLVQVGLRADDVYRYPHSLSGGQRQRVAFARALAADPLLVVADEPLTALDVPLQLQMLQLLRDLQQRRGWTWVLISHQLAVVRWLAGRIGVMYQGRLVELAPATALQAQPLHPYTQRLWAAELPWPATRDRAATAAAPPDAVTRPTSVAGPLLPSRRLSAQGHFTGPAPAAAGVSVGPDTATKGCAYAPLCPWAQSECWREPPVWRAVRPGHYVACHASG